MDKTTTHNQVAALTPMIIGGEPVMTGRSFEVIDPATEHVIGVVPCADPATIDRALHAAHNALRPWSSLDFEARRGIILSCADLLEGEKERLLDLLIAETGKSYENASYDFGMLVTCLRYFVEVAGSLKQEVIPDPEGRFHHYLVRQPRGVVVGLLAWNYPLLNLGYKLGPLLAAGCTAVIKPSHETPLATLAVGELLGRAGLPSGVVNFITANDYSVTDRLLQSPIPAMVTMIGSTAAGREVMRTACASIKHFSVELGGNAPAIVYPDADVEDAAHKIVDLKFTNAGQVCVSPNRCFVHEDVYDAFVQHAAERIGHIRLGVGRRDGPLLGPLISVQARDRVLSLVQEAVDAGAEVVCGGKIPTQPERGFFMEPTVLREVHADMRVAAEEIFGPVLPVIRYTNRDDVVALANDTDYGLAAYVFTRNPATARRAAEALEAGSVCVNEPYYAVELPHGGLKQSGVGKDCSPYSLEEYLTIKRISVLT